MQPLLAAILYCAFSKYMNTPPLVQPSMFTMTSEVNMNDSNNDNDHQQNQEQQILALPSSVANDGVRQFSLGETLKLEELGPIIINSDGTTRRITNWNTLSKNEQTSTWRLISARNKKRIEELKLRGAEETQAAEETEASIDYDEILKSEEK